MEEEITEAIQHLRRYRDRYFETAKVLLGKESGILWKTDLYYFGVFNRSYCLLRGYCDLLSSENFLSAIPLVRLQLDCCLRVTAPGWVGDPSTFTSSVLGGTPVKRLKDKDGKFLTDAYLLDLLAREYPWVRDVYQETSGFIHFSEKHIFNAMQIRSEEDDGLRVQYKISDRDQFVPTWAYQEAIGVFRKLSDIFLEHMAAYGKARARWQSQDENQGPDDTTALRATRFSSYAGAFLGLAPR